MQGKCVHTSKIHFSVAQSLIGAFELLVGVWHGYGISVPSTQRVTRLASILQLRLVHFTCLLPGIKCRWSYLFSPGMQKHEPQKAYHKLITVVSGHHPVWFSTEARFIFVPVLCLSQKLK